MSKIAFCFPGQGSVEAGMGRDIAEAMPEAHGRLHARQRGVRPRPRAALLPRRRARTSSTPRSSSRRSSPRRLAILAAIRARGIEPDFVVGHSVGEFAALAAAAAMTDEEAIALVRERGIAMAEAAARHPGSMAAILGLEDEVVETLCRKILGVWPANYNCPGQIVDLRRERRRRRVLRARHRRRARAGRSSSRSPARSTPRSSRGRPTGCGRRSSASASRSRSRRSCRR